ncbi:MAG: hypothetical protein A2289_16400 [Deltaproteobacteria bacterium RIFOXYA12_FULL_58_15]|nr:MAG: hypothetical protein A2289_16400 [Deltaproteobacteria bacterium RIFOXYA12_FULL_58_15]
MGYSTGRIIRSRDGIFAGVCQGIAQHFGISANLVRLFWLLAVIFMGTGILVYLVMWWIIPHQDAVPADPVIWKQNGNGRHLPPLQRTAQDRKFLGVCGGISRRWDLDPSVVRLVALSLATLSFGLMAVAYLVVALFMPGPEYNAPRQPVYPIDL